EFEDIGGVRQSIYFPIQFQQSILFEICHEVPETPMRDLIFVAAKLDAESEQFRAGVDSIPVEDRMYTWRIANADADLGGNGGHRPCLTLEPLGELRSRDLHRYDAA